MYQYTDHRATFFMESNKFIGSTNFLAWKKRIDLLLKDNELLEHVKGNITISLSLLRKKLKPEPSTIRMRQELKGF